MKFGDLVKGIPDPASVLSPGMQEQGNVWEKEISAWYAEKVKGCETPAKPGEAEQVMTGAATLALCKLLVGMKMPIGLIRASIDLAVAIALMQAEADGLPEPVGLKPFSLVVPGPERVQ